MNVESCIGLLCLFDLVLHDLVQNINNGIWIFDERRVTGTSKLKEIDVAEAAEAQPKLANLISVVELLASGLAKVVDRLAKARNV